MTINATTAYYVRAGGNDVNGGGYDSAISGALSTTLNGSITTASTTVVVTSATGWPGSGNYYARIGTVGAETAGNGTAGSSEVVLVTGGQGTTSWTVTRAQLGTSAVAFASGVVVDNNLSNADTAAFSGSLGTSTASTTFTDAAGAFNLTVVGNTLWLASGTGTTVSAYAITGFTNSTTITLDRASGTYTVGVWKIGGAWAAIQTNVGTTYIVPGSTIYLRGAGSTSPGSASPDFTHATGTLASGSATTGFIFIKGSNGFPVCKGSTNTFCTLGAGNNVSGIWFAGAATGTTPVINTGQGNIIDNCVFDQNGFDQVLISIGANGCLLKGSELFNSGSAPAAANNSITFLSGATVLNNNFHDLTSGAISSTGLSYVLNNIFSNCGFDVIVSSANHFANQLIIIGNTFDAGVGHGIIFTTSANSIAAVIIANNIFSNFSTAAKFAINGSFNSQALNDILKGFIDYNAFYNNTANYNAITAGTHDVALGGSPYVAQATQNYTLTGTALNGVGYLATAFLQHGSGKTNTVRSFVESGAVFPTVSAGGGLLVNPGMSGGMRG